MKRKSLPALGLWLCLPGFLFLCDPNIAFRDVLPNTLGYLLLIAGIFCLSDLFDRLQDAVAGLTKMLWIGIGALFARLVLQFLAPDADQMNAFEGSTLSLIIGFALTVMQLYYLLPAMKHLFLGLEAVLDRHGTKAPLPEKHGKSAGERMAGFSAFFVVISSVLPLLPEMSVLSGMNYAAGKAEYDWYRFIGLFRTLAGIVTAIVGIIWFVRAVLFVLRICRDAGLIQTLTERYACEILPSKYQLLYRRACFSFYFLLAGIIFWSNLRIDEKNILPTLLCALFGLCGLLCGQALWKGVRGRIPTIGSGIALLLTAAAHEAAEYLYFERYESLSMSIYATGAYRAFLIVRILSVLEALTAFVFVFGLIRLLCASVRQSTTEQAPASRGGQAHERALNIRVYVSVSLLGLSALGNAAEAFWRLQLPWLWWTTLILSIAASASFASLIFVLRERLADVAMREALHKNAQNAHTDRVISYDTEGEKHGKPSEPEQSESQPKSE